MIKIFTPAADWHSGHSALIFLFFWLLQNRSHFKPSTTVSCGVDRIFSEGGHRALPSITTAPVPVAHIIAARPPLPLCQFYNYQPSNLLRLARKSPACSFAPACLNVCTCFNKHLVRWRPRRLKPQGNPG